MKVLIRVLITAAALAVATGLVSGIQLQAGTTLSKVSTLIVVALIFGVVNAVLKPIVKTVGCLFYILTLGLAGRRGRPPGRYASPSQNTAAITARTAVTASAFSATMP